MDIGAVQNAMVGMAIFDMFEAGLEKHVKDLQAKNGDPLIAAAGAAFEQYVSTVEAMNNGMIQGLSTYCLSPKGGNGVISQSQMAPLLALSVLA